MCIKTAIQDAGCCRACLVKMRSVNTVRRQIRKGERDEHFKIETKL